MLTPEIRDSSAGVFAAELEGAGYKAPRAVVKAREALTTLQVTRRATPDVGAAEDAAAADLVARSEAGTLQASDLADLAGGVGMSVAAAAVDPYVARAFAQAERVLGAKLSTVVAAWISELVPGELRTTYLAAAKVIGEHAAGIPETFDDTQARKTPHLRGAWDAACDAADSMIGCLTLVESARNVALYPPLKRDPAGAFSMIDNPYAVDNPLLIASIAFGPAASTLPEHWTHRLLEIHRRGGRWWFPTSAEQDAAAGRWLDADRSERARLAGAVPA